MVDKFDSLSTLRVNHICVGDEGYVRWPIYNHATGARWARFVRMDERVYR